MQKFTRWIEAAAALQLLEPGDAFVSLVPFTPEPGRLLADPDRLPETEWFSVSRSSMRTLPENALRLFESQEAGFMRRHADGAPRTLIALRAACANHTIVDSWTITIDPPTKEA